MAVKRYKIRFFTLTETQLSMFHDAEHLQQPLLSLNVKGFTLRTSATTNSPTRTLSQITATCTHKLITNHSSSKHKKVKAQNQRRDWGAFICVVKEGFSASSGLTSSRMLRFASDRVYRVSSLWFAGAVFLCSATLHVCQTMYRPKQFYAWHATSVTEFHPSQTGADRGVVLPVPGCIRFVQTAACFGPNF